MKTKIINAFSGILVLLLTISCSNQLDLTPVSSISNSTFWKTSNQFDAFVTGIHSNFRNDNANFQLLGEMRADIFGTDPPSLTAFTGEATQGLERTWLQTLTLDGAVVGNFGGFYNNIVELNLLISQLNTTNVVTAANKNYYLGIAYGMRAFYYFHLLRSWGGVVIQTDPVTSFSGNLAKAASSVADVTTQIKSDIDNSVSSFGTDYTFRQNKAFWSKAATLMLKAEVYLWTSYRGGGTADATVAQSALTDIQTNVAGLSLQPNFTSVFSTTNRGNSEIIFASRYMYLEAQMSFVPSSFTPQNGLLGNYYDSINNIQFVNEGFAGIWGGLLRAPVKISAFRKFNNLDTRKWASVQAAYTKPAGSYVIAGCFSNKYLGENQLSARQYTNDYPIYRYADLLLMLAETKIILGQDPSNEMNLVRARAYGVNYNAGTLGYPNQGIDSNPTAALLQERFCEFVFEGKRWYDLLRTNQVLNYISPSLFVNTDPVGQLLWPIDRASLINNRALVQTAGYSSH
ncbi:MAG: SusD family outer membrane lipoprotein NanU [Bacteroidetes bacterium]|nr:SusD family outer membrane lipoprotein NanU [Bacteroidota bacterium]MBS1539057.1 SusD family outer membrane lipoprotein NanU [Bacteroidota bacterium]